MKKKYLPLLLIALMYGCIGNDYLMDEVEPELRISASLDTIAINSSFQFEATYLNNVGQEETVPLNWESSQNGIINIDENGLATATNTGQSTISVTYESPEQVYADSVTVVVGETSVVIEDDRSGSINTTSSYVLTGDFTIEENGSGIVVTFANNYQASSSLPGLYLYLSNNPNSIANAHEVGMVDVYIGAHQYNISEVGINEYNYLLYYCKPFNVKVGHGEIE
ncbi:MAG: hypothetical protein MI974_03645 [Chitinophagales bacterium]|nr:hypothetical protein [Chitinophagales bacterium]